MRIVTVLMLLVAGCDNPNNSMPQDLSLPIYRDLSILSGSSNVQIVDQQGTFPTITVTTVNCVTTPSFYFSFPLDQLATPLGLTTPIYGGAGPDGAGGTLFYISSGNGSSYPYSGDVNPFTVSAAGGTLPTATLAPQTSATVKDTIKLSGSYSCN
jgi:hypothetical protein